MSFRLWTDLNIIHHGQFLLPPPAFTFPNTFRRDGWYEILLMLNGYCNDICVCISSTAVLLLVAVDEVIHVCLNAEH